MDAAGYSIVQLVSRAPQFLLFVVIFLCLLIFGVMVTDFGLEWFIQTGCPTCGGRIGNDLQ